MRKFLEKNIKNSLIFVLGVIVTILFTKTFDKIIPNNPIIVKEYTDTLKIVYDFKIPNELNDDSIRLDLESKVKNLELLNSYDKQIKAYIALTKQKGKILPNLILTNKVHPIKQKGYTYGSSSSYFTSKCPTLTTDFIDIHLTFFNPSVITEIAYLRVNIYRYDDLKSLEARTFVLEEYYEVKLKENFIRISNDLRKGKYEIIYGFVLKSDLNKKFPTFYFKKCILAK